MVHYLLNDDRNGWSSETINAFFDAATVERVLQIRFSRRGGDDFVCWLFTKHGNYTVRSSYFFARWNKFVHCRVGKGNALDGKATEKH
jgi:hypothetical protein